ncbi:hypothetical protein VB780_08040 [Leptolyngbya sp. CCNP1308]|uniref:hypothetical protein n=1 Tax=Leptolyngbya sp. CCNP1308 TaxID=3110255 RepID=UPI002B1FC289|nr:hypothetical protein [Leptolyngbya sp. CCNP1308]MEA5448512.1 hypothetical protein [Leptolyngbya sp. CCNP1308]
MNPAPLPKEPGKFILEFIGALTFAVLVKVLSEHLASRAFWEPLLEILNGIF